jgi:regulator of sigma E protease
MTAVLLLFVGMAALSLAHELGHAAAARSCGFHITDICIGLGPALLRFERRGIRWMIGPVPLGGFVRVAELAPEDTESRSEGKAWFSAGFVARRMAVIGAGPGANYVLAAIVTLALALGWGMETGRAQGLRVVSVDEGTRQAGLAVGDLVSQANGHAVGDLRSLSNALADSDGGGLAMVSLHRGGLPVQIRLPRLRARSGAWGLGAKYVIEPELLQVGLTGALVHALSAPMLEARTMLVHAADLLTRRRTASARPLGMVGLADRVHATKGWSARRVLMLGISLSVAMGLFNLLPFPGLDGGRLCIEAVQAARRRRLPTRSLIAIQVTGGLILLMAWLLLTAFEIYRW